MNKKDIAEEYAIKEYERLNDNDPIFEDNLCFSIIDIETAFNAGRKSMVEKALELEWEDISIYGEDARYVDVCRAHKPLEEFLIREWFYPKDIELECNDTIHNGFKTIEEAKSYAKEVYKQRIKQVLEL